MTNQNRRRSQRSPSRRHRLIRELVANKVRFERGIARDVAKEFRTASGLAASTFIVDGEDAAAKVIRTRVPILAGVLAKGGLRVAGYFSSSLRRYLESLKRQNQKAKPTAAISRVMKKFIEKNALRNAENISKNTIKKLKATIADGVSKKQATSTIAKRIDEVIDNPSRAKAIARTEVHTAASYAQDEEARNFGIRMIREWATAQDESVRPTHAEADGQQRSMDEPFIVGGASLMYPGDPSGPSEEIINCRCVLLYEPDPDATN